MNDFSHAFFGYFIAFIALGGIAWCLWLLFTQRRWLSIRPSGVPVEDTGHVWDEDLTELNNPVPRWWTWMYLLLCLFALGYLLLMPGLGMFQGVLGYTTAGEVRRHQAQLAEQVKPVYARYVDMAVPDIAADPAARQIGERLFLNTCAQCHGSDARGARSFPNLTDTDWMHGGTPDTIEQTITHGRHGIMPPWKGTIDPAAASDAAHYVRSLSNLAADPLKIFRGRRTYETYCVACHGVDGKGNQALGAPNLTDSTWLYGSSEATIVQTILEGRDNRMPAHDAVLTPEQIKILTAWVWGLSNSTPAAGVGAPQPR